MIFIEFPSEQPSRLGRFFLTERTYLSPSDRMVAIGADRRKRSRTCHKKDFVYIQSSFLSSQSRTAIYAHKNWLMQAFAFRLTEAEAAAVSSASVRLKAIGGPAHRGAPLSPRSVRRTRRRQFQRAYPDSSQPAIGWELWEEGSSRQSSENLFVIAQRNIEADSGFLVAIRASKNPIRIRPKLRTCGSSVRICARSHCLFKEQWNSMASPSPENEIIPTEGCQLGIHQIPGALKSAASAFAPAWAGLGVCKSGVLPGIGFAAEPYWLSAPHVKYTEVTAHDTLCLFWPGDKECY